MTGAIESLDDLTVTVAHWHARSWGGAEYLVGRLAEALEVETIITLGSPEPSEPYPWGKVTFEDVNDSLSFPRVRRLQRYFGGRTFDYAQWEDVDWEQHGNPDVLVTSGATARAVITPDDMLHLNYCHSPPRWLYDRYHSRKNSTLGHLARPLLRWLRLRDQTIDPRVDHYFANSPVVARRLWKYYKRGSELLPPPVDLERYRHEADEGYYLYLGRLDREKGIYEIIEAFEDIGDELVIAGGSGDAGSSLIERIGSAENLSYRGFVDEEEKFDLLSRCRAVVFNARNEDFGLVPVEANASGKPVLVPDEGFPSLFVDDGQNGLIHDGTSHGISRTIDRFESESFDGEELSKRAEPYGFSRFRSRLRHLIVSRYNEFMDWTETDYHGRSPE